MTMLVQCSPGPDQVRYETLAGDRLQQRKGRKLKLPSDATDGAVAKQQGTMNHQMALIRELTWKHAAEREVSTQQCINAGFHIVVVLDL